ncbi:hypothetical protein FACS1894125_2290 [Actinomycetota bacterium]|nr:hypothetical protein FACS1894125_2290 [Actinomycetota bacterium]
MYKLLKDDYIMHKTCNNGLSTTQDNLTLGEKNSQKSTVDELMIFESENSVCDSNTNSLWVSRILKDNHTSHID